MDKQISESDLQSLIRSLPSQWDNPYMIEQEIEKQIEQQKEFDTDSYVKIENNEIIVRYSQTYVNKSLVLLAEGPVKLKLNQVEAGPRILLNAGDQITWVIDQPPLFEIHVSDDEMKVYLTVYRKEIFACKLKDALPSQQLNVEVVEDKNQVLRTLTAADIMIKLQEFNIKGNIEYLNILSEVSAPTGQPIVLVQGQLPQPGQDAELLLFFSDRIESKVSDDAGNVNYRNHLNIPQVQPGDLIAKKRAAIHGRPGLNVYGQIVFPAPPKDITILAKDNVELKPTGEVYALTSGRPKVLGQHVKYFDISKEYIVLGDVNMETGNITFSGDIIVYGNVLDNMLIESLGNVYIMGNVHQSTVTATGSIYIQGNVTNSHLYSGYFGVIFNSLYSATKDLVDTLMNLTEATNVIINILASQGKSAAEGVILNTLIETKYHSFYPQIRTVLHIFQHINSEDSNPDWLEFKRVLKEFNQPFFILNQATLDRIAALESIAKQIYINIQLMQENAEVIQINQCTGSTLKSNGDIKVRKEGTVQSFLFAKNQIIYEHLESVCRGGEIEAGNSVYLMAVGGRSGTETIIKANNRIFAKKIYLAKVCIGKGIEHIYDPLKDVTVSCERGRLRVQGEKLEIAN